VIQVKIQREEEVSEEAAISIVHAFQEWLEEKGVTLVPMGASPNAEAARIARTLDNEETARLFVEEWS
jgi:protein-L-isoaspartate O-methyltransferase